MRALLTSVLVATLLCSAQCESFTATISTQTKYRIGDDINCEVTITNNDAQDYRLITAETPLEGLRSNTFAVRKHRKVIKYDGIHVKRPEDHSRQRDVLIRAKSSLVSSVDLSEAYSFHKTGVYRVKLKMNLHFCVDTPTRPSTTETGESEPTQPTG